ncbi:phospholipid-translocating P-type ATPase [Auriculariales sp. MPI-PUGE-AT-0066]|nr:phospholipid-translocating P-type ATPase [Auriculariales sp. MPI-PUGE-AT-0066]
MAAAAPPAKSRKHRHHQRARARGWWTKLVEFDVAKLFARRRPPGEERTVFVNTDLPPDALNAKGKLEKKHMFATNQVLTSKYTIITFLPRNLLEQFRRIANVFFAAIAILQFFPRFSTISPGLVVLPLIVVLALAAIKDGYEDIKRHQSDRVVNYSQTHVLAGGEYSNRNGSEAKSKTFVRGLPRVLRRRSKARPTPDSAAEQLEKPAATLLETALPKPEPVSTPSSSASSDATPREDDDNFNPDSGDAYWKPTIWEDIRVGDVVRVADNESFPADIVICATSEEENVAYVETKNLDGETNLKSRHAVPELAHLRSAAMCADPKNSFKINAERPTENMYKLNAAVETQDGQQHAIDIQTVLLRGTVLRNTKWIIGIVLYTGTDTKIVLNSGDPPSKRSKVERQMNPQVFINLAILGIIAVVCAIVESILERKGSTRGEYWFIGDDTPTDNPSINGLITFGNALITFQNVVPISLYISIEFVRTCQALWIYFDFDLWYQKTDSPALARSWNLSDDLGQIEYIFSDKTGTLTQNVMIFRQCSVGGRAYKGDSTLDDKHEGRHSMEASAVSARSLHNRSRSQLETMPEEHELQPIEGVAQAEGTAGHFKDSGLDHDLKDAADSTSEHARMLNGFFSCIALCHSALTAVDPETHKITYKAQSPDEAALVQAAADVGFVFLGREREVLRIQTPFESGEPQEWELLEMLDFTSARKRMSVIVRRMDDEGRIVLFSKGADNVIFERLAPGKEDLKNITEGHLEDFANDGLRTLCLAYKIIQPAEYEAWAERYHEATVALDDRDQKIDAVSEEIEKDLRLLGATAIEDRLQDGVPEAIAELKRAGIKVWVATGDKLETAIAIGYSTYLIARDSNLIIIRDGRPYGEASSTYEQLRKAVEQFFPTDGILDIPEVQPDHEATDDGSPPRPSSRRSISSSGYSHIVGEGNGERPGGFVLVVDGASLSQAFRDDEIFTQELLLELATRCEGVICCRVSPLQKAQMVTLVRDGLDVMTLAIGDGANDVSMIQAAHVGVGITGEEGLQAVNSSDYAVAQFRFLTRLLFVHGHWSYYRNGNMIVNFFYKNIVCIGVLFWFQIYCQWSTTYVFDYTYLLLWNVFWTIAPVIAIGLFDRLIDDDILTGIPELYRFGREQKWFGFKLFSVYMFDAVYQSAIIFFFINYTYDTTTARHDGYQVNMYEFSNVMVIVCVMAVSAFNGLNTHAWTWWVVFAVTIGPLLIWAFLGIYSLIAPGWFLTWSYGNSYFLFRAAYFWFGIMLAFVLALAPRYVAKAVKAMYFPNDLDVLRAVRKSQPDRDILNDPQIGGHWNNLYKLQYQSQHSVSSIPPTRPAAPGTGRPSQRSLIGSRTDMATGMRSSTRIGFQHDFEEGGYAMQRMATNLSERRIQQLRGDTESGPVSRRFSIRKSIRKRMPGLSHS